MRTDLRSNPDGTLDGLVRITGFSQESGFFEEEYTGLVPRFATLPERLPAGVRLRLSWRVADTKETHKYLRIVAGLPTIRSRYWGRKRAAQLLFDSANTAEIIDMNGWVVEVLLLHLRFDPNWLRKPGPKGKG